MRWGKTEARKQHKELENYSHYYQRLGQLLKAKLYIDFQPFPIERKPENQKMTYIYLSFFAFLFRKQK